jgi:hypothetical protein
VIHYFPSDKKKGKKVISCAGAAAVGELENNGFIGLTSRMLKLIF